MRLNSGKTVNSGQIESLTNNRAVSLSRGGAARSGQASERELCLPSEARAPLLGKPQSHVRLWVVLFKFFPGPVLTFNIRLDVTYIHVTSRESKTSGNGSQRV